jgi:ribose 5-phosphate isomerase B
MAQISDSEIHRIVEEIVQRTMGVSTPSLPARSAEVQSAVTTPGNKELQTSTKKTVALGSDHGGFALKELLKTFVTESGYNVIDCGTTDGKTSVDYPDFALAVALLIQQGKAWRGIVIDGAGIGSCMAANKVPGVRAALCYDYATAVNSREHNDANLLTLGAGLIGINLAKQIVQTWLSTDFGGERHQKRINKIIAIEKRFNKE